ncbi:MAG: exodeoxyribonuclease VII large subunit [Planctomycetota bacterium]|nr:exodeoxyribonuclease VII large subunit [Planctomycetota bacterium]
MTPGGKKRDTDAIDALFDPDFAAGGSDAPAVGARPAGPAALSVSSLLQRVKAALAGAFAGPVTVVGEVSGYKRAASGHLYFRLKDSACSIDAAMFRPAAAKLKFEPADGLEVVIEGRVDVYDARGQLQLYVERMTPRGQGALELAFRQLKDKLEREGLFDPAGKKPIPRFPRAIGLVTSPTGAAIRDIQKTLARRWPIVPVYLMPALVQGDQAAAQIARAIALLDANAGALEIDVILLARGGGSLEDLWAFNEEPVARAVFAAGTPIICGVGHETDVTIADLVADLRAPTPTAAAELATPDRAQIRRQLDELAEDITARLTETLTRARAALASVARVGFFRDPAALVRQNAQRLDELSHRLRAGLGQELARARERLEPAAGRLAGLHPARQAEAAKGRIERLLHRLRWALGARAKRSGDALAGLAGRFEAVHPRHALQLALQKVHAAGRQLEALSYRRVLHRGFSVTRGPDGTILRSVAGVGEGDRLTTELADGTLPSVVGAGPARPAAPRPARGRKDPEPPGPGLFDSQGESHP